MPRHGDLSDDRVEVPTTTHELGCHPRRSIHDVELYITLNIFMMTMMTMTMMVINAQFQAHVHFLICGRTFFATALISSSKSHQ
jgi:hypothetical protein